MNLTPKQKKVALFIGIGVIAIGYLLYRSKKNKTEGTALLDYVRTIPSQVDLSKNTDTGMTDVRNTKVDWSKIKIGTLSGDYKNPAISNEVAKVISELWASMKGASTDVERFYKALFKIKNKNTLAIVDQVYKLQNKEGLFEAMKGEWALNNVNYAIYSDKTKNSLMIPLLSDSKWSPVLSVYFSGLQTY